MNIIDSSFWIEYFSDGYYADLIVDVIEDSNKLLIPTVIVTEVFKWILKEREEASAIRALASMKLGNVVELNEQIAVNAAYYGIRYKLTLADSFIYSTALFYNAEIFTLDKHFKDLPNVQYFEKNKLNNK